MKTIETFVMMPFGSDHEYIGGPVESDYVYEEIIQPGITKAISQYNKLVGEDNDHAKLKASITREVDSNQTGSITSSIIRRIAKSDVVIVDITGRNPNVFLELGIRYALRSKVTVLLAQTGTKIPFDIKVYRYIEYNHFKPAAARKCIAEAIQEGLTDSHTSDSIVFDVLPSMYVNIPGVAESAGVKSPEKMNIMPWKEYMERIEYICSYLLEAQMEHQYFPDAVIGITNGGLISADLIGKRVYAGRETPVLSLWAKRHVVKGESAYWYFDNEYNDLTMTAIKNVTGQNSPDGEITILLIDDHMGTGSTARQAVSYIQNRLGERAKITFIPVVSRRLDNIGVVEEFLPYSIKTKDGHPTFTVSKEQFLNRLQTTAQFFPYLKKQVNVSSSG